ALPARPVRGPPAAELGHIVRSTGLGTRPHRGALPATEGLPLHDRAGDVPVHVRVADLHMPQPVSRSEEHTSELQSRFDLVCRLLLEKKKKRRNASDVWCSSARFCWKA